MSTWERGWPSPDQLVELGKLYEAELRLRKAMIPSLHAEYVIFLPTGWLEGDPVARAFGMQVLYHPGIDRPVIGFDPAGRRGT